MLTEERDEDVVVRVSREDELHVVELTETESRALGFWIATGQKHADVEPVRDDHVDAVYEGLMGASDA